MLIDETTDLKEELKYQIQCAQEDIRQLTEQQMPGYQTEVAHLERQIQQYQAQLANL